MKLDKFIGLFIYSLGLSVAGSVQADNVSEQNIGGLHHTFTSIDGNEIAHSPEFPVDGLGVNRYLTDVCKALQHDGLVSYKVKTYTYLDTNANGEKIWIKKPYEPRIYKSITCNVYVN